MAWAASTAAWVGVGLAAAGTATSLAMSATSQPQQPNLSSSSRELSDTNAALLPLQRGMTAAMQSGGDYTFSLPQGVDASSMGIATTGQGGYDAKGHLISSDPNYSENALAALQNPLGRGLLGTQALQVSPQTQQAYRQWLQQQGNGAQGLFRRNGNGSQFNPTAGL